MNKVKTRTLCGNEVANNTTDALDLLNNEFSKVLLDLKFPKVQSIRITIDEENEGYRAHCQLEYFE